MLIALASFLYQQVSGLSIELTMDDTLLDREYLAGEGILVLAIGVKYGANDDIAIGPIHLSGLAIAAIVGIFLNAIMPSKLGMKVKSFKGKEKS